MKILSLARCLAPLGAAAALCAPGFAAELAVVHPPLRPDSGSIVVHCGSLIDGTTPRARRNLTITIRDGHVASVTPGTGHDPTLPFLELGDYTCLPGLIDMHTHLTEEPEVEADLTVLFTRSLEETQAIGTRHAGATISPPPPGIVR